MGGLPRFQDAFLGGGPHLAELVAAVRESRFVLLTGPPGVGKTRLAAEAAARLAGDFPDGVHFIGLAGIRDPKLVPRELAASLSIWDEPGTPLVRSLKARLRGRRILIVLDNCEHVAGASADLAGTLFDDCPSVFMLATSQLDLGLRGFRLWAVDPLPLPRDGDPVSTLAGCDAVRLFLARARAVRPGFRPTSRTIRVIAEICRRLDGLPLAIELAATRLSVMTPEELASRLGERFSLLSNSTGTAQPRHRSLQTALEWSHELLSDPERRVFRRLSVFAGPSDLEAVNDVAGDGEQNRMLDALAGLAAKSLVQVDIDGSRAQYRMLETVRLFAADQLERAGETGAIRARHGRWCLSLAERAEPRLTGSDQTTWLVRLDDSHNDLRSALAWSLREEPELALQLAGALAIFWRMRGCFSEGRDAAARALWYAGHQPPTARAKAMWALGFMALMLGDRSEATQALNEGLALARQQADEVREARCLLLLGNQALATDRRQALRLLEESGTIARRVGDAWTLAHAHGLAARSHIDTADSDRALAALGECLSVARESGDEQGLRLGLILLGELRVRRGEFDRAEAVLTEALEVSRRLREPYAISEALALLGDVSTSHGRWEQARELYAAAAPLALDHDEPQSSVVMLSRLGHLARVQGDDDTARRHYDRLIDIGRQRGSSWELALHGLSEVAMSDGRWAEAEALLEEALRLAEAGQDAWLTCAAMSGLARVARHDGEPARALSLYSRALDMCRRTGAVPAATELLEAVAGLAVELGGRQRAARLYGAAEALRRGVAFSRAQVRQPSHEADIRRLRRMLGDEVMDAAWAQGARLNFSESISYALRGWGRRDRGVGGWSSLTPAERRVIELVAQGLTNGEIGAKLFISPRTVETHLTRIFSKLALKSRAELRREAVHRSRRAVEGSPKIRGFPRR